MEEPVFSDSKLNSETINSNFRETIDVVEKSIITLQSNQNNSSYRILEKQKGLFGRIKWILKKIIRRLNFFYVQPICDQQTLFNTSVTQGIESLKTGEFFLYQELDSIKKELQNVFIKRLEEEINEKKTLQEMLYQMNLKVDSLQERIGNAQIGEEIFSRELDDFLFKPTYSQSGEDAIIQFILYNLRIPWKRVTYLDLGANHARELSNTYALYIRGARGVLLEANPELIPELKLYRSDDIILNRCLSLDTGEPVTFYILNGDGLSSPDKEAVDAVLKKNPALKISKEVIVETVAIKDIFVKYFFDAPTILNIDIEGMEYEILNQIDFVKHRPLIVIVEMIEYNLSINNGQKNMQLLHFMEDKSYIEYAFTGINSIFVDKCVWNSN